MDIVSSSVPEVKHVYFDTNSACKYWDFIETGTEEMPGDMPGQSHEQSIYFRKVLAALLNATVGVPAGYVIDVLMAQYIGPGRFPVIALGWNYEEDDEGALSPSAREAFINSLETPLRTFVEAVDWDKIGKLCPVADAG
jgi:hypothetical protein